LATSSLIHRRLPPDHSPTVISFTDAESGGLPFSIRGLEVPTEVHPDWCFYLMTVVANPTRNQVVRARQGLTEEDAPMVVLGSETFYGSGQGAELSLNDPPPPEVADDVIPIQDLTQVPQAISCVAHSPFTGEPAVVVTTSDVGPGPDRLYFLHFDAADQARVRMVEVPDLVAAGVVASF
jgi:hypothetical protein